MMSNGVFSTIGFFFNFDSYQEKFFNSKDKGDVQLNPFKTRIAEKMSANLPEHPKMLSDGGRSLVNKVCGLLPYAQTYCSEEFNLLCYVKIVNVMLSVSMEVLYHTCSV